MSEKEKAATEIFVCDKDALKAGVAVHADLDPDRFGRPRRGMVLLDLDGEVRGYLDRCQHLPIPLGTDVFDEDKRHLICITHGALYRLNDGKCIEGPCKGMSLCALEVKVIDGGYYLIDDGVT